MRPMKPCLIDTNALVPAKALLRLLAAVLIMVQRAQHSLPLHTPLPPHPSLHKKSCLVIAMYQEAEHFVTGPLHMPQSTNATVVVWQIVDLEKALYHHSSLHRSQSRHCTSTHLLRLLPQTPPTQRKVFTRRPIYAGVEPMVHVYL
uniref:Uncharacterized protein n=1 Tax=Lygus hesperus TaxID=30085 RepID=A0A0A9YCG0_LYGHE